MGNLSVSSRRCCMFVSCVHTMAVLNAAFCMTCSLLMLVEDARYYLVCVVPSQYSVVFCTRVAWVCLVCLLLCKEEGSSPVSLQLLRGWIWACTRCPCL